MDIYFILYPMMRKYWVFPAGASGRESSCNEDVSLIPESERFPGKGNDNPLQYFCLEHPMDRGVWWATVHGVTKSCTRLSNWVYMKVLLFICCSSYSNLATGNPFRLVPMTFAKIPSLKIFLFAPSLLSFPFSSLPLSFFPSFFLLATNFDMFIFIWLQF